MGYYSETAIALTNKGVKTLQDKLDLATPEIEKEIYSLLNAANQHYVDADSNAEVWHWDFLKWYESEPEFYPDIYFMQELLDSLDDDDYRFIRIGEDYDDTEVRGEFTENPFDLELARSITLQSSSRLSA